jgi:hypothetical protein
MKANHKLTLAKVRSELSALGLTVRKTGYGNEILVRIKGSPAGHGCFCDGHDMTASLHDALASGKQMARHNFSNLI